MSFHAKQQSQRQNRAQPVPLSLKIRHLRGPAPLLMAPGMGDAHGLSLQEPPVRKLGRRGERGPPLSLGWGLGGQQALGSDPLHLSFLLRLPV